MANRYRPQDISSLPEKPIFFDANVIIYVFWPLGKTNWEQTYSSVFGNLLKHKKKMTLDVTVISEVINRTVRFEHENHLTANNLTKEVCSFKNYRDSQEGKDAIKDIYDILKLKILTSFQILGKAFSQADIEPLLSVDTIDFSDKVILTLCKENDCILLTNDKDFASSNIDILTSNPVLLRH
ncbi:MAG: DUF5615 family PIN-like protein [Candidatus Gracilibacteria bacterium]|nr:DUF5615 family PIN-like protein [Candidatus Gracilibacteria bacterium]